MFTTVETHFSPRRTWRLDLDAPLPIVDFLESNMSDKGLSPKALIAAAGYTNITKGLRRYEQVLSGDFSNCNEIIDKLPEIFGCPSEDVARVLDDTRYVVQGRHDRDFRLVFKPHVIWACTNTRPTSIAMAGASNAGRFLRFDPENLDLPAEFSTQAVQARPEGVPLFGRTHGFYVNYSPDVAVLFDKEGEPVQVLDACVRPGYSTASVGGRSFRLDDLVGSLASADS